MICPARRMYANPALLVLQYHEPFPDISCGRMHLGSGRAPYEPGHCAECDRPAGRCSSHRATGILAHHCTAIGSDPRGFDCSGFVLFVFRRRDPVAMPGGRAVPRLLLRGTATAGILYFPYLWQWCLPCWNLRGKQPLYPLAPGGKDSGIHGHEDRVLADTLSGCTPGFVISCAC